MSILSNSLRGGVMIRNLSKTHNQHRSGTRTKSVGLSCVAKKKLGIQKMEGVSKRTLEFALCWCQNKDGLATDKTLSKRARTVSIVASLLSDV